MLKAALKAGLAKGVHEFAQHKKGGNEKTDFLKFCF